MYACLNLIKTEEGGKRKRLYPNNYNICIYFLTFYIILNEKIVLFSFLSIVNHLFLNNISFLVCKNTNVVIFTFHTITMQI